MLSTPERKLLSMALSAMDWLHETGDTSKLYEIRDELRMYFFRGDGSPPDFSADEHEPQHHPPYDDRG